MELRSPIPSTIPPSGDQPERRPRLRRSMLAAQTAALLVTLAQPPPLRLTLCDNQSDQSAPVLRAAGRGQWSTEMVRTQDTVPCEIRCASGHSSRKIAFSPTQQSQPARPMPAREECYPDQSQL